MIDEILTAACRAIGYSYRHARKSEANVLVDARRDFPMVLRQFPSKETKNIVTKVVCTLYFCDALGIVDPDTEGQVQPRVSRMGDDQMELLEALRADQRVVGATFGDCVGFSGLFDAQLCGVAVDFIIEYKDGC